MTGFNSKLFAIICCLTMLKLKPSSCGPTSSTNVLLFALFFQANFGMLAGHSCQDFVPWPAFFLQFP